MIYNFTVSPDFSPERMPGWFIFNTWLQKTLSERIHLELYPGFSALKCAIEADQIDLIYANPYDAAMLVRERGFSAIGKPSSKPDEAVIAVGDSHPAHCVEDLQPGTTIASTDDPDVNMMGMIMLEPAELGAENTKTCRCDNYVLVAKALLRGQSDVGFFLAESYQGFSEFIRSQLRPLVTSQIHVINHTLMAGPRLAQRKDDILRALTAMTLEPKGKGVLDSLEFGGWVPVDYEEMEFMIDLVDTLSN